MTNADPSFWSTIILFLKGIPTVVWQTLNFVILAAILVKFCAKPLKDYLQHRHDAVKETIDETSKMLTEAETLRKEYEERLARLDDEIEVFKNGLIQEAEQEKARILAEATQFASKIQEQARLTYEQELRDVKKNIREEIARLTMEKAEKMITEKMSKSDHDVMIDDFIAKLRSMN